ncbi:hypothetical protein JCM3765_003571 [Sporobolomyces pararoseus]
MPSDADPIQPPTDPTKFGDAHSHTRSNSQTRPGTQDELRGQGNSHATLGISRQSVAPAGDPDQSKRNETFSKEDKSSVVGQKENNKEREIPNYITTGKDESNREPSVGKVAQPPKDNEKNLVEAGTTMAGDADAYGGLEKDHIKNKEEEQRRKSHL